MRKRKLCEACHGSRRLVQGDHTVPCWVCHGRGTVPDPTATPQPTDPRKPGQIG